MNTVPPTIAALQARVGAGHAVEHRIAIACGGCTVALNSNSAPLIANLEDYFQAFPAKPDAPADIHITALQMPEPDLGLDYRDWPREAGKTGRKDSYVDLTDGRALRKAKTGMQYLIGDSEKTIFGDCLKNDNQVVNFVIAQQIGWLMKRGWVLCHAAAVAMHGRGVAISAFSGGGKSTLALHLMNQGLDFVSNDRTLISASGSAPQMHGVPKHPRINPGTILNNHALRGLLTDADAERLGGLSKSALWALEEKYDARIDTLFGAGRFRLDATLDAMMILNWSHTSASPTAIHEVDIAARPDLLAAVMKAPGPFFEPEGTATPVGIVHPETADYIPVLSKVPVFEATGRTDFDAASAFIADFLKR